jgi:hypothetical protein
MIEGAVFVRMLQVQAARFDRALNVQEQQRLVEGDAKFAVLIDRRHFCGIHSAKGDAR